MPGMFVRPRSKDSIQADQIRRQAAARDRQRIMQKLARQRALRRAVRRQSGFVGKGKGKSNRWDAINKNPTPKQRRKGVPGFSKPGWGRRA